MNSLLQRKQRWEEQNQQVLLRLVQTSSDVSVESVILAGRFTSFLLYVSYIGTKGMLVLLRTFLKGPQLIQLRAPNERPLESHELERTSTELNVTSFNIKR